MDLFISSASRHTVKEGNSPYWDRTHDLFDILAIRKQSIEASTLGRRSRKKGIKCLKCGQSQNVSHNYCSSCGEKLVASGSTQSHSEAIRVGHRHGTSWKKLPEATGNEAAKLTVGPKIEPAGELRDESSASLEFYVKQQPTKQMERGAEDSLSQSSGDWASALPKKAVKVMKDVACNELSEDGNPLSRKRRREKTELYEGSRTCSSLQQKKKKNKKNMNHSDSELQNSLTSLNLPYFFNPEMAEANNPSEESQNQEVKLTESVSESTGDSGGQIKSSSHFDTSQNSRTVAENSGSSIDSKDQSERENQNDAEAQHAGLNLAYSLSPEMAEANNPPKENHNQEVKWSKLVAESTDDSEGQIKNCSPLHTNRSSGVVTGNPGSSSDKKDQSERENQHGAEAQHDDPGLSEGKLEEGCCKTGAIIAEQTASKKTQSNVHTPTVNVENASETEILGGDATTLDSRESTKISDLHINDNSSENIAKLNAEAQSQVSETRQSRKMKIEQEAKQMSASASKKIKVERENIKTVTVCKKVEEMATPKEELEQVGKTSVADQKKQQANQKDKKQRTNQDICAVKPSKVHSSDVVTVYFHAILSPHFKLDPDKQKVFVRAEGISGYESWKDVCEMFCTEDLGDLGHLIQGYVTISKDNMDKWIPYKYFISCGAKGEYETIYKPSPKEVIVNRCLFVPSQHLINTDWHQYDDIICAKPPGNIWNNIKSRIPFLKTSEKDIVKGKQRAMEVMLNSIFSILCTWTPDTVKNFLMQFHQFYLVNKRQMVHETRPVEWTDLQFGEKQIKELILGFLRKRAHLHLNHSSSNCPSQKTAMQNKLGEALIIFKLGINYSLPTSKTDLTNLCSLLCLEKPLTEEVKLIKDVFSGMEENLTLFCHDCIEKQVDQWLWTIPVLHLFTASVEYKYVQGNALLESEERWSGLASLPFVQCRDKDSYQKIFLQLMKEKHHLVKGNRALFRSWFSLLPLRNLVEFITDFPADLLDCLLGTFFRFKSVTIDYHNCEEVETLLNKILYIIANNQNGSQQQDIWDSSVFVSLRLHQVICKKVQELRHYKLPVMSAEIVSRILGLTPLEVSREKNIFQALHETTRAWLRNRLPKSLLNSYMYSVELTSPVELAKDRSGAGSDVFTDATENPLFYFDTVSFLTHEWWPRYRLPWACKKAWDCFLKIKFPIENLTGKWKRTLISEMESRIKKEIAVQQIKVYCCCYEKFEEVDPVIRKTFENCAIEAINLANREQINLLDVISSYNMNKLGKLVSAIITKSWPSEKAGEPASDSEEVLNHLLIWPDIKHLFTFNGARSNILDQLTDEAKDLMTIADSVHTKVSDELIKGCILVKHFEMIAKHKKQFLSISELKWKQLSPMEEREHKSQLEGVLQLRQQEVLYVKREQKSLGSFLDMCRKVQDYVRVDIAEIEQKHFENLTLKALDDIVKIRHSLSHGDDKIETYYNLSPTLKKIIKVVNDLKESHVFQYCWERAAQELVGDAEDLTNEEAVTTLELDAVPSSLFEPCYDKFTRLYQSLKSGELTFAEVDILFKDFTNQYKELKKDLQIMCEQYSDDGKWIDQRAQQIQQYHELHLAVDSAKIIGKVREGLNLSGDFTVLLLLLNFNYELASFQQKSLSCMSPALMHAKKLLQGITESRRVCLEQLVLRRDFVNWVKEALEDVNELKVFVDLASISAGENDMDVDRVACFHDAVLGYSSMLYELKQESGFEEFMKCLEKLWKALESDSSLPQKLCDSARYLEWLKTIKESHGSVELSSISLATTINEKGIYRIRAPAKDQKVSLEAVLCLTILESHGDQEEERQYSLEELRELMNKLMLMSGKVEQSTEVEKFSEVFSSVQRLALTFIDLYSAGNMLFRSWIAEVYCSSKNKSCISMDFKLSHIWNLSGSGELTEVLPAICRMMESFLERWNHFMSEKRSQYYYLNYYTAEQLVYLCGQLRSERPSEAALMMLSFIKHNCNQRDVLETFRQVLSHKSRKNLADPFELMENDRDLLVQLERIWESYMEGRGFFLPGYLDIETLGMYLAALAGLERRRVMRMLPQGLHAGKPNLILCPHSEVLASALAIYMSSPEEVLPSYDEVLLCTPQTSYEQVALFLRRCLTPGRKEKKIYTLLYADELSYDVGCRSEELFKRLHSKHQDDYCFVILCNCEREHCYIPSAFSQFKVHMIPQQPLKDIQLYLGKHYRVMQPTSASASVFKGQACVGIVSSKRAGMGKSLYVKRLHRIMERKLQEEVPLQAIRLIDTHIDEGKVLKSLLPFLDHQSQKRPMIFHFDITSSVQTGIPEFLFKLLVLHYLSDADGKVWVRKQHHLYVIEILEASTSPKKRTRTISPGLKYNFINVFPKITCKSPKEVLELDTQRNPSQDCSDPGMDDEEFCSEAFQRPSQYLRRSHRNVNLDTFLYKEESIEGTPTECLQLLLIYCGVIDPSWSELRNFAWFLNLQLKNCETSVFCNAAFVQDTLQGFKNFVVAFMILMAKDFATPSLNISDESPGRQFINMEGVTEEDLVPFRIRKKWESEPHPYIFFNDDSESMTFIGFHLQRVANGGIDAINPLDGSIIKENVMTTQLYEGLCLQRVPFNINFDSLPRHEKIEKLSMVLGLQWPIDPDETYELTTDNMLKILAIEMRFRCGIPVVLMGETGCGKTRLIKFLCELRRCGADAENMKLVKVHGGTTADAIYAKVREAEALAIRNKQQYQFETILFFDEANTTEAVSSIKEVLCDRTVQGQPLVPNSGLQIIAACNPYRKHTERMIQRLESAGLGYRVKAEETKEKLGSIPLRQLVYRVHALPPSMIPLVWDFGQLNNMTEKLYIQQIAQRLTRSIQMSREDLNVITEVLFVSQTYMRQRNDECGFISLRDVERCVEVLKWFHSHGELLMRHLETFLSEKKTAKQHVKRDPVIWSLVLSVGVCYHASLEKKKQYREKISKVLPAPYNDEKAILEEVVLIQDLFLSGAPLPKTIARNLALKENVFMMVICIELKIPLFLIGKPGSSKSLAKTIVADAMQGQAAYSELYKELKQIHLVSFQCSPHSTPEGIINTFKHCARFQEGKNLKEYVSVVVLDEIGLAEDSPKMPLKTLHPLLEDGCVDDDPVPHKKVGFIGISNWALDPAKMNRGIFVSRGDPNKKELIESAKGICSSERITLQKVEHLFPLLANAYDKICKNQVKEFFGLRDYYSLIKMVFALAKTCKRQPPPRDIAKVVLRNFSGNEGVAAVDIFMAEILEKGGVEGISTIDLVQQNIYSDSQDGECRYLLVLTENYAALQILQQAFFNGPQQPEIIFGSSFPRDQEYTQICRNINRVKICMETGQVVVLLNLQNLYESLYDALNQYYVQLAGQKYVDLGLGTHRVKCRVHPKFRLIVIEEKEVVYKHFPIPLINRLEKHYLDINSVLNKCQREIVEELKKWVTKFTAADTEKLLMGQQKYSPSDVFVGYHSDTCASVVLQLTEKLKGDYSRGELMTKVQEEAKLILLNCATPDSVVRLGSSQLGSFLAEDLARVYFQEQHHTSLADFLQTCLCTEYRSSPLFTEITTFSRLLTAVDAEIMESEILGNTESLKVLFLQQFDTEHSFLKEIWNFLDSTPGNKILIIQTDFENGPLSAQLIASAKYSAINEINKIDLSETSVFVFFITKLSRVEGGSCYVGFHGGLWQSVHIDDLRTSKDMVSDITTLRNVTISQLFSEDFGRPTENLERKNFSSQAMMIEAVEEKEEEMEIERATLPSPETCTTHVLDTTNLLRSCVQSAVGMLRDQSEEASRSMKRIKILLSLLTEEGNLQGCFLRITKDRLLNLLRKQEESSYGINEWVLREASNPNALQEAGTFRHTLWKRIQSVVIPFLAYIISVLDRDSNLELLVRPTTENCVKALWMFIFKDLTLLNIPYIMGQSSSQTETILVQNYFEVSTGNEMPFSWKIKDYLENLWVQAQYTTGHKGHADKFIDIFQKTPLGQYIAVLPEGERGHLFHCYLRDFILLTMGTSTPEQLKLLQMALLSCIEEMKAASSSAEERVLPLPWIHLGYYQFRSRLQNFSRILAVYPDVFGFLTEHVEKQGSILHHQMVLDLLAAVACTEVLEAKLMKCRPQTWLQQVKNLQMPVELVCTANYSQSDNSRYSQLLQDVKDGWNRIFIVSLFMEHVLLGAESLPPKVQDLVKKYTRRLAHCFQTGSDIKTHKTFTAVMKALCQCKEEASSAVCRGHGTTIEKAQLPSVNSHSEPHVQRVNIITPHDHGNQADVEKFCCSSWYGLKPCPICMGDPRDPVNLPCDHIFCQTCIKQSLVPGQMHCPLCLTSLPNEYIPIVSEELRIAIGKNAQFRKFCNSFFLDLVSTMCFKDNEPPEKAVIQELLKLLFVQKEILRGDPSMYTKSLSPFDDVVDKTPVIRSVLLKLLLKYSFNNVKAYMQEYLSAVEASLILDKEDKTELCILFVNCLEDSTHEQSGLTTEEFKTAHLREEGSFLANYHQWSSQENSENPTVEYLQEMANIRLCMDRAAELLFEMYGHSDCGKEKDKQLYLLQVMRFCLQTQNDWFRVYLVRKLTNQYGLEFTQRLSTEPQYHWIFPAEIIQQQQESDRIDRFLICGKNYKHVRDAVGKAMVECQIKDIEATGKASRSAQAVHFLLAVFRELTSLYGCRESSFHPKQKQCDVLKEFIKNSEVFPSLELKTFAESLVANSLPSLMVNPEDSSDRRTVIEMTVHTAAVLLSGQNRILEPLKNLAFLPSTMQHAFLPTMPEDLMTQAAKSMGNVRWYTCPNGHPCTVGECGAPMQISRCVDCGAAIGGENHRAVSNFTAITSMVDRTQTGHVLGDPRKREGVVASERDMSPAVLILIRLLTHLALLLGATKDPQSLLQIIKPQVPDPVHFLMQHIQKDLEQLMNTLGKSVDETASVVHLILSSLLKDHHQHIGLWPVHFDGQLSTKEKRNNWEGIVARAIIVPELKDLDRTLLELNQQISEDERISSNPIVKIIYGDPTIFLTRLPKNSTVHSSRMWSCRKRISVEHLGHIVQQKSGKDAVPILWKFLQKEAELRLVKFLPEILNLQKDLVRRFQNIPEVEPCTIGDFLNSLPSESIRNLMKNRVNIFLSVWNRLRRSLETNGEIKLPQGYCDVDLALDHNLEILVPRRQGLGLCSTALASYLISLHNNFVYAIKEASDDTKRYSVNPMEVADLHVITYEVERDLIPLILSNCQYSIEKGREALEEFDLEKIQQQIISRFLRGKPLITLRGIPTLVYRHDRNYERLFSDIKSKLNQSALPNSTISTISGELQSYSDICEALSITETTLGFLAMAGGDSKMTVAEYVENILQMGSHTSSSHVLKALSRCHLEHIIAVWQLLSCHKSEQLLHRKRDPFAEISPSYKESLTAENSKLLNVFLAQAGLENFLQELHEMIILKLKHAKAGEEFNPTWGLKDTLVPYLENKDSDFLGELEDAFPEEILLSQCISAWKTAAVLKRDRDRGLG